ncbi:MAG: S8 family serine peptidase [Planctomycetia bacterium]|nr:S8 family serine peptidase [Planctomycetia bacterium]
MRSSRRRGRRALRVTRLEPMEPRLLMSADPTGSLTLDDFVECSIDSQLETSSVDALDLAGPAAVRADYGFTGAGQTVAVIDSGIAYSHVALGGGFGSEYRVVGGYDFTGSGDADPYDGGPRGSHGTHVAGIIGSSNAVNTGVAPEVDLVALRVFDDQGRGSFTWVEQALEWVHDNRNAFENPITTVNLSLGGSWNSNSLPNWAILEDELAQLEADGIFISVAAGNQFTTHNSTGLAYPAASSHVVPVASVDPNGTLSYYSQRNARVIAAPGRAITSTVPDYRGNGNGVDDDFATYSGTSMAAPYVAGASVLLREAYAFAGVENVDQATLYELMSSTADTVYDPITRLSYYRLNLDRAIAAVMPKDDFGSVAADAFALGSLVDTLSLDGAIASKDDADWFRFTAARSGKVTFDADVTREMKAQWDVAGTVAGLAIDAGRLSFDVVAGQTYRVGLATAAGLGYYTIDASLEASSTVNDFGAIEQKTFSDNRITAAGEWFSMTATTSGILTVEALLAQNGAKVTLELYDANHRLLGRSQAGDGEPRVDVAVSAGDRVFLRAVREGSDTGAAVDFRVTNLVSRTGSTVKVLGTDGDDTFDFAAGGTHRVVVNGVGYNFAGSQVTTIRFDGRGGTDTAVLAGTAANETAEIRVGSAEMRGTGYRVSTADVENLTLRGGAGADTATFYDSAGNDTFVATPRESTLRGDGFSNLAENFEQIRAVASAGLDTADFYDSAGNDTFVATLLYGKLYGAGFYLRAEGFRYLYGHATAGGEDVAYLRDSAGDDTFIATPDAARLEGAGFRFQTEAFERVYAYATEGGRDTARLFDSAGNDAVLVCPTETRMSGSGFDNRAKFFEQVYAESDKGRDSATLYASGTTDRLQASAALARLLGEAATVDLSGFEHVRAYARPGGLNTAEVAVLDYVLELLGAWDATARS